MVTISASQCNEKKTAETIYKGRLEISGICMNYTIKLLEGNIDTSKIVSSWIDENSNKTHTNVFALANPCNFPGTIKEGNEFYFKIETVISEPCMVCEAYYPIPGKKLSIKIVNK